MCYWYRAKLRGLVWGMMCSSILFILINPIDYVYAIRKGRLMVPSSYTALSGDLHVQLQFTNPISTFYTDLSLEIYRLNNNEKEKINTLNIYPDPRYNLTQISIDCHNFILGGVYELEIINNNDTMRNNQSEIIDNQYDERLKQQLDVRWPTPKLSVTPELIGTYPEEPVDVIVSFPEIECEIKKLTTRHDIAEFWLELIYCGQEILCSSMNGTNPHVLYAEQVRGFPKMRLIKLRCELFGLAGHYVIQLRPIQPTPSFVSALSYVRADWNEKFVFNVHARSIFPCDPHTGIKVLFEYPACILDQADRVRLFAKLRADVASLKPPTSLHYVTEQRVIRGQHSLYFDCDFFSEKFIEFCFVYVSQAISGAVADIRMDCLPTLPVSDSDTGGWGPWSDWTPCSTTCTGGTRNRYRFCDSPPPRYGAKFCEGPAVETDHCGKEIADTWDCLYGPGILNSGKVSLIRPEVSAEIGPGCRCGCIVHLGTSKPKRMLASSAQSCPGRTFWLIQADDDYRIKLIVDFFRMPCSTQYVKIRDGDSLASTLISEYIGGSKIYPDYVISTDSQILVEFFSDEITAVDRSCNGGFLAHVLQIATEKQNVTSKAITQKPQMGNRFTVVHIAAVIFAGIIIIISALLGTQYILRYRKYHLTESRGEGDSPIHTPRNSIGSLQNSGSPPSRAISTTTLLSEVIYLVKIRPRGRMKHSILRESVDAEMLMKETGLNDDTEKNKCNDSIGSTQTLTNEIINNNPDSNNVDDDKEISISSPNDDDVSTTSKQSLSSLHPDSSIGTLTPRNIMKSVRDSKWSLNITKRKNFGDVKTVDGDTDTESLKVSRKKCHGLSASAITLANGCYSPAASVISTATIRTTNQKESKEKQNREKLLARPDSEFSLANPEDLELDYYDYNVINAGAAPGSYLGMDPAYLVWIPPLDDGNIINECEETDGQQYEQEPYYEEISPNYQQQQYNSTDSNTEASDENDIPEPPPPINFLTRKTYEDNNENLKNNLIQKKLVAALLKEDSPKLNERRRHNSITSNRSGKQQTNEGIQLNEIIDNIFPSSPAAVVRGHIRKKSGLEKETSVVKSPSDNLQDYYELDDIQFADEDDSNESDNSKSKTIKLNTKYHVKT